jgi:hypothetical protein
MNNKKQPELTEEAKRAPNFIHKDDWIAPGESGIPDDPFDRPKGVNPFLPPVCNKCGKPKQPLNRYSTCKDCEALMRAGKLK